MFEVFRWALSEYSIVPASISIAQLDAQQQKVDLLIADADDSGVLFAIQLRAHFSRVARTFDIYPPG